MHGQDAVRICDHHNRDYSRTAARDEHPAVDLRTPTSRSPRYRSPEVNELNVDVGRRLRGKTRCRLASEAVPAPSVFDHGVVGEQGRAGARDPLDRVL
jgi:hypothetical protein